MSGPGLVARVGVSPLTAQASKARTGERLALVVGAAAIAFIPVLQPIGPGHTAPVDPLIALTIGAWLLWASFVGTPQRLPYALSVAILMVGGALGALVGPVPTAGPQPIYGCCCTPGSGAPSPGSCCCS
jgi:hypothetical protein